MTDLRDAAQQALKSLRGYRREIGCEQPCDAERALEAALEQPEQEPVARVLQTVGQYPTGRFVAEVETVRRLPDGTNLYTHPSRREWRGLTEEEILPLYSMLPSSHAEMLEFARAVEAALKERNV